MRVFRNVLREIALSGVLLSAAVGCPRVAVADAYSSDLVIAERGKEGSYSIVLPENPSDVQEFAAAELQAWTRRLTDVELPVDRGRGSRPNAVYLIEPESRLRLGDDGFNVRAVGKDVYVRGGRRGVIYGVYELLETYGGIGWFSPSRTVVPGSGVLKVPDSLYDTQRPTFEARITDWLWAYDKDTAPATSAAKTDFYVRLRMNASLNVGIPPHMGGSSDISRFVKDTRFSHTFLKLVPPKVYFKDHPEYFSLVSGQRRDGETQLCLTNPDVLEVLVANLLKYIDADPGGRVYGVSQEDWDNHCTCANCRAVDEEEGSHAGSIIRFVNAVAERIEKVHPGLQCITLAYQYTRKPPKTKPAKNVIVAFCNIECDWSRPLSAMGTPENAAFSRDFLGWTALTDRIYFWDYTTNYWWPFHAFPDMNAMQENLKFFRDHGVRWVFEEGGYRYADFAALKCWMLGKLMWNPDQSKEALLDRFFKGYYGAAAPYARACFDAMHRALARAPESQRRLAIYENDRCDVYSDDLLVECLRQWRTAEKAVAEDPGALANVRIGEAGTVATILDRAAANTKFAWATRNPERFGTFERVRAPYKWMMDWIESERNPYMRPAFGDCNHNSSNDWARASKVRRPDHGSDRALVAADALQIRHDGSWGMLVDDPEALNGRAVKVTTAHDFPCVGFSFKNLAYDDVDYRIRLHVKVDKVLGAKGEAFQADVRNGPIRFSRQAEDLAEPGYVWYDIGTVRPKDDMFLRFGMGRFSKGGGCGTVKAVYIDGVEISVAK